MRPNDSRPLQVTQNSPMEAIKEAQANWQELVVKRLNEYRVQSTMPLARRQRPESELLELRRKGQFLSVTLPLFEDKTLVCCFQRPSICPLSDYR